MRAINEIMRNEVEAFGMTTYTHLQVATAFDLLSSTLKIDELVTEAKKAGFQSLAMTNHNQLYGAMRFQQACKENGIKAIYGMTIDVESTLGESDSYPVIVLAKNTEGYHELMKLTSALQTEERAFLPKNWFDAYSKNIVIILPVENGEITNLLPEQRSMLLESYPDAYLGVSQPDSSITAWAFNETERTVVISDVRYLYPADVKSMSVLKAIRDNEIIDWETLPTEGEQYLISPIELEKRWFTEPMRAALKRTNEIAASTDVNIELHQKLLPKYVTPDGKTAANYLHELAYKGLAERFENPSAIYQERLSYELKIISEMGFDDYFLIVWDLMFYAQSKGILTGPGRGSAAGSLVSYVLKITDVDPIAYRLLFERFLNPERVSMPDIDLDFPDNRRDELITYTVEKYGVQHVAQIGTFGTLAAKAAIRDTARVFGLNRVELSEWSNLLPAQVGLTLKGAEAESKALVRHIKMSKRNEEIWRIATTIEGLPRHMSTHAAGVIISDAPLIDYVPLQQGSGDALLTQYPMGDIEAIGLLKMDYLGLRNLTMLATIIKAVRFENPAFDIEKISLNDADTLKLFQAGDTNGVFQFESPGIRRVLQRLIPTSFEDVVAVNALYRPGPMEQISTFIARKHGKEKVTYTHPALEAILEPTYGVIVYQEQIMQIASALAGFSLGEADMLRRAVSKKKAEVLQEQREHFIAGAQKQQVDEKIAEDVYDLIVRFANYGFNRSHSVAYAKIAFQLAYLKAHYPAAFYSALMTSVSGDDNKIETYIAESRQRDIKLLPPSVNASFSFFSNENGSIRYALSSIKKVGAQTVRVIVEERKTAGKYTDFFDFCRRLPAKVTTQPILEALILAGACDEWGKTRTTLLASIEAALNLAELSRKGDSPVDLFGDLGGGKLALKPKYTEMEEMPAVDRLTQEKEYLGTYLSEHPLTSYPHQLKQALVQTIMQVPQDKAANFGVYIHRLKETRTKNGELMCFLTVSDASMEISAVAFPNAYRNMKGKIAENQPVILNGKVSTRQNKKQLIVNDMTVLDENDQQYAPKPKLYLNSEADQIDAIKLLLESSPGSTEVIVVQKSTRQALKLNDNYHITLTDRLADGLTALLTERGWVLK